ncbi:heme peroxidase [Tanacetum coccineum]
MQKMNIISILSFFVFLIFSIATASSNDYGLSTKYYERVCPQALPTIKRVVEDALGGPTWDVKLGRRDSTTASQATANITIPSPFMDLPALIKSFEDQGLDEEDLVVLSGAHTLGFAQCRTFRSHIYNDTNIDPAFAGQLRTNCPQAGGDSNLAPLDPTPSSFDTRYFNNCGAVEEFWDLIKHCLMVRN